MHSAVTAAACIRMRWRKVLLLDQHFFALYLQLITASDVVARRRRARAAHSAIHVHILVVR
jgi:hypothetical protein